VLANVSSSFYTIPILLCLNETPIKHNLAISSTLKKLERYKKVIEYFDKASDIRPNVFQTI
jgi:hypothetical protein